MILRAVVAHPDISEPALVKEINRDEEMVREALRQLRTEGFIVKKRKRFFIKDI
jgi:DNA-binding GntR family transcriptional regulator